MSMFEATGGIEATYRGLLGSKVVGEMIEVLGDVGANKFLKLHAKYDALARKHPDQDPITRMSAHDIPAFDGFDAYVKFLKKLAFNLRTFKEPVSKALYALLEEMLNTVAKAHEARESRNEKDSGKKAAAGYSAVAGKGEIYQSRTLRGKSLPAIPVVIRTVDMTRGTGILPYSYPSWDATLKITSDYADDKDFRSRLEAELTSTLKAGLVQVIEALPKSQKKTIKQLVVEAQEYLMDHNWIQYNLENVARASFNIASAGVKHQVTVNGLIQHVAGTRTLAYTFLGLNLERVLRRGYFALLKDITNAVNLAGRTAGLDVLSCACSYIVQEIGRNWLDNVQSKLK